jgi:hypothetical protein
MGLEESARSDTVIMSGGMDKAEKAIVLVRLDMANRI